MSALVGIVRLFPKFLGNMIRHVISLVSKLSFLGNQHKKLLRTTNPEYDMPGRGNGPSAIEDVCRLIICSQVGA